MGSESNIFLTWEYCSDPFKSVRKCYQVCVGTTAEKTYKQDEVQAVLPFRHYNLTDLMVSAVNVVEDTM